MFKRMLCLLLVLFTLLVTLSSCSGSSNRGDGVHTCSNCGRSGVYCYGYCKSCFNSFCKWLDKQ